MGGISVSLSVDIYEKTGEMGEKWVVAESRAGQVDKKASIVVIVN